MGVSLGKGLATPFSFAEVSAAVTAGTPPSGNVESLLLGPSQAVIARADIAAAGAMTFVGPSQVLSGTVSAETEVPTAALRAVQFDGLNDMVVTGSAAASAAVAATGAATFVFWSDWDGDHAEDSYLASFVDTQDRSNIRYETDQSLRFDMRDSGGAATMIMEVPATVTSGEYHHFMGSFRLTGTHSANSGDFQLYKNDVDVGNLVTTPASTETAWDFTHYLRVGGGQNPTERFGGRVAGFAMYPQWVDLSVTANRRVFITSAGTPVDIIASGQSDEFGTPWYYFNGDAANWAISKGTEDDSNIVMVGALTSADSPTAAGAA